MDFVIGIADGFIAFFKACGETVTNNIVGTIPSLLALLFLVQFVIKIIGDKKINQIANFLGKSAILSYLVLPTFAWFFFSSPGALILGKFLPEKRKPGFEDALGTTVHPLTSLFPHIVPSELGYSVTGLAIRAILVGTIMGLVRGIITEKIFLGMLKKNKGAE